MKQVINIMKQKNNQEILLVANHNLRQAPSRNVVKSRTPDNKFFVGSCKTNVLKELEEKLSNVPKFRKDAVKTINLVLSASPEFFDSKDEKKIKKWEYMTQHWAEETFGKENIIYSVVHNDETTKHFHICLVPIKDGKLNASYWLDGPAKLNKLHDSYAKLMKPLGISRGQKQIKSSHTETQEFYNKVNASTKYERQLDKKLDDLFDTLNNPTMLQKLNPWGIMDEVVKPLMTQLTKNLSHYRTKAKSTVELEKEIEKLELTVKDYQLKMETLGLDPKMSFIECEKFSNTVKNAVAKKTAFQDGFSAPAIKPEYQIEVPSKKAGLKINH